MNKTIKISFVMFLIILLTMTTANVATARASKYIETYNADIFPYMKEFISHLTERNFQNRTVGIIENGSWAPAAAKIIKAKFEKSKNITFAEPTVTLVSSLTEDNKAAIKQLARALVK